MSILLQKLTSKILIVLFFTCVFIPAELVYSNDNTISAEAAFSILNIIKREEIRSCLANADSVSSIVLPHIGKIKYRFGGNGPKYMDCSKFTGMIMQKFGVTLPRTSGGQAKCGYYVTPPMLRSGDLVFFDASIRRKGPDHVGVMIDPTNFAHCTPHHGAVVTSLKNYKFKPVFGRRVLN